MHPVNPSSIEREEARELWRLGAASHCGQKGKELSLRGRQAAGLRSSTQLNNVAILKSDFLLAQEPAGFLLRRNLSKSGWRYIAPCAGFLLRRKPFKKGQAPFCRHPKWSFSGLPRRFAGRYCISPQQKLPRNDSDFASLRPENKRFLGPSFQRRTVYGPAQKGLTAFSV